MAADFIPYNHNLPPMSEVVAALQMIKRGRDKLNASRGVLIRQINGDTVTAAHFPLVVSEGGFSAGQYADANTAALAAFAEIDSLAAKLNAPGESGDATGAALDQCCAKLGII